MVRLNCKWLVSRFPEVVFALPSRFKAFCSQHSNSPNMDTGLKKRKASPEQKDGGRRKKSKVSLQTWLASSVRLGT